MYYSYGCEFSSTKNVTLQLIILFLHILGILIRILGRHSENIPLFPLVLSCYLAFFQNVEEFLFSEVFLGDYTGIFRIFIEPGRRL